MGREITPAWLWIALVLTFLLMVAFFVFLAYVLGPAARLDTSADVLSLQRFSLGLPQAVACVLC